MYLILGILLYILCTVATVIQRNPHWVAWSLIGIGTGLATLGAPIVRWKPDFRLFYLPFYNQLSTLPKLTSETIHANLLAGVLLLTIPLLMARLLVPNVSKAGWIRLLEWGGVAITLLMLVLTQSRAGYLGIFVSIAVLGLLRWPRLLWGIPLLGLGFFIGFKQIPLEQLLNVLSRGDSLGGWAGRLDVWTHSAYALQDFVFTGIGIGTFTLVIPLLYPIKVSVEGFPHAHNLFLQIGLDLGLPGLIAYLAILMNCVFMLWRLLWDKSDLSRWTLALGAAGGFVGMMVQGLFDAVLWGTKVAFMSWLLFALITLLHNKQTEESLRYGNGGSDAYFEHD
ncbi:MAG: O-antigen ligase family protein [Chloroflexota bacterium]